LARRTGHLERFLIFGSFVTNQELPGEVDIVLVMAEAFKLEEAPRESRTLFSHAEADARFGHAICFRACVAASCLHGIRYGEVACSVAIDWVA
jgi:hypothetical protein